MNEVREQICNSCAHEKVCCDTEKYCCDVCKHYLKERPHGENGIAKEAIKEIREMCWGYDIPSPCCPEYREHHEQMQELLKLCDKWLKKLEK